MKDAVVAAVGTFEAAVVAFRKHTQPGGAHANGMWTAHLFLAYAAGSSSMRRLSHMSWVEVAEDPCRMTALVMMVQQVPGGMDWSMPAAVQA